MKIARRSCGPAYTCQHEWAEDCFVQCGGSEKYGSLFFEAFPRNPDTFLRGNSKVSIAEAEEKAWNQFQKHLACELDHTDPTNFERRHYRNGVGFCVQCGFNAGTILPSLEICAKCGINNYYARDINGDWWCEACFEHIPEELMSDMQKMHRRMKPEIEELTQEEFEEGLKVVIDHLATNLTELRPKA